MAAPDKQGKSVSGEKQIQIPLEELSRDEPFTPPPLPNKDMTMTAELSLETNGSLSLETNGSDSLTVDGVDHLVTSTEGVDNEKDLDNMDASNDVMDTSIDSVECVDTSSVAMDTSNDVMDTNNDALENETNLVIVDSESNNGVSDNETNNSIVADTINNIKATNTDANLSVDTVDSNNLGDLMVQTGSSLASEFVTGEAISQQIQVRPPFKGVMVPCPRLKEYLDSLPTFHRKTMLRKGREVHKIYVDLRKGESFLDDQFSYTEFGKLVLTNGSIRAGRAKNAKQIVVARETLYCSGTGSCKRACGGFGICVPGCEKTKMRGHRCGYRVKLTQRLGFVNFWFVECLGSHDQLGAKNKNVYDASISSSNKLTFAPNFAVDLTNTANESVKTKGRSPANHSKLIARFTKTVPSSLNGNLPSNSSDSSPGGAVNYHYVLDNEPMGLSSSAHNSREPTPIDLTDTSPMRELYSDVISSHQQAIDIYQKHAQEAAINAIKAQGGFMLPTLTPKDVQPQDLSAKTFSSPLLVNVKQEPINTQPSPNYMSQDSSTSPLLLSQGQGLNPNVGQGHLLDRPMQKMQATQETLGQVHSRIMERAKSRKSSKTVHIPREPLPESKPRNIDFLQNQTHLQIPMLPPVSTHNIPNVPLSSTNASANIDFKRFQTLNKILQSEAFQAAKQQLENSWNQSASQAGFQSTALNLTKKEPETGTDQLDHTRLLEEWRKGGQLQEFQQQFNVKKESLPNGHQEEGEFTLTGEALTKNEKDLLCRVHQLEAHVKQLQNIVIKKEGTGVNMAGKRIRVRPPRPFDFNKYNTRHVALKIAYLGWDYQGFALQEETEKTIEEQLFRSLKKTRLIESRETSNYHKCGRTDKGVSAFGQVISIDLRTNLLAGVGVKVREGGTASECSGDKTVEIRYVKLLNAVLPPEIRVLAWAPVDPEFSARFSCKGRTYKYIFPKGNLDIQLMNEASQKLVGQHDFRNLCKADIRNGVTHFIREIRTAEVTVLEERENGYSMCELTIVGSAFLWHQIRCIFGVLKYIGEGNESVQIIDELLDVEKNPRKPEYNMAADIPLCLFDTEFGDEFEWIYEADCHEDNIRSLQELWAQHAVKATTLKRMLDDLDKAKVETDCDIAPWSDLSPPVLSQADWLQIGTRLKYHKPLMERQKCECVEERIAFHANKKKKLNSGEAQPTTGEPQETAGEEEAGEGEATPATTSEEAE